MKPFVIIGFLFALLVNAACGDKTDDTTNVDFFKSELYADMEYHAIIKAFGEPDEEKGSGIHILVYNLSNQTQVWIGCTDTIIYAYHVDKDEEIIEVLLK